MNKATNKISNSFVYKFLERIGAKGIYFFVSVLLARILFPDEYGIISLSMVFIELCEIFVSHGFGNSLVVFQDSDEEDFSTCLYFCLLLSILFYLLIVTFSKCIAMFFDQYDPQMLSLLIKVLGIRLPIGAINIVQHAYIRKHMLFKEFFWATLFGTLISGIIAIIMAYMGFGVWALVEQYLGNIIIDTVLVSCIIDWKPKLIFSVPKLKRIVEYGWKILIVGLIDTGYAHLRSLVVGKNYSPEELAYYSKGTTIPRTGVSAFEETLSEVFFSALANSNDKKEDMVSISQKALTTNTFLIFPIIVGIGSTGKELIVWMLTAKWLPALIFLEIGCLAFLFRPMQIINNCIISASGKSDMLLISDLINKVLGVGLLIALFRYGVVGIAFSYALTNILSTIVNIWFVNRIIPYTLFQQLKDISKNLVAAILMGIVIVMMSIHLEIDSVTIRLFLEVSTGVVVYCFISFLLQNAALYRLLTGIRNL